MTIIPVLILIILIFFRGEITSSTVSLFSSSEKILHTAGVKMGNFFSIFSSVSNLRSQNKELAKKILELEVSQSKMAELEKKNKIMEKELGMIDDSSGYNLQAANVIGRDPTNFSDYLIIDQGFRDGVKSGMAVLSGGAMVGQVNEVSKSQSKVTLITSSDSLILAMLQESRTKGTLAGGISGLTLEDIDQNVDFKKGEYIVTSGLDGQLKSGILIGKTVNIEPSSSGLFKSITVDPVVDLSNLEIVFLVK